MAEKAGDDMREGMKPDPQSMVTRWRVATVTFGVFLIAVHFTPTIVGYVLPALRGYARSSAIGAVHVAVVVAALAVTHRMELGRTLAELGLRASILQALAVSFVATLPMLVAFSLFGSLRSNISLLVLFGTALSSPVTEEVLFRGYASGQLYRRARWGFWPAVLVPTLYFSISHLYQASNLLSALGIIGVTAIGGVWFSWLYMRWDNLWVPIGMHAFMNLWWYVFTVDNTALGGWMSNVARLFTILLSLVLTLYRDRLWKPEERDRIHAAPPRSPGTG